MYGHMLIVVAFLVVNFFVVLVITLHHGFVEGHHKVDIFPRGFPKLFKPTRDLLELRRTQLFRINMLYEAETNLTTINGRA